MTDYNDGEIHIWRGGECPVHPRTKVKVWWRGEKPMGLSYEAGVCDWPHSGGGVDASGDIIAFQVTKPYVEQVDDSQPTDPAAIREAALRQAAEVARTLGVGPELNIWVGGPEWYHPKRVANAIEALIMRETKC